ncbi:MAG: endospore germination permease [Clostridiaceae bacterium]|nr:endospore germination permease [Clostridiaceae bacterium]
MEKEVISQKQAVFIISSFIVGSSAVLGAGSQAKQDVWLAIIIAMVMASLIIFVYARISTLFPGKDIYEILNTLFGKVFGKILSLIFISYAFRLTALIIRDFMEFVRIISLSETPVCVLAFSSTILVIWAVRGGIELLGRSIAIFSPIFLLMISTVTFLSIPLFNFSNLKPVLYDGLQPVLKVSFGVFTFPFAELVVFLCLMGKIRRNSSIYKIYYSSLLFGGILLLVISLRSVLVLGVPNILIQNFASYASSRLIRIGSFIQRIEASIALVFMISGYTKATVCLYAVTKGVSHLFNIKDYRKMAAPIGILLALYSIIVHSDAAELIEWATDIYPYYAIPFQIIIPVIVWITAEIKTRTSGKNNINKAEDESAGDDALPSSLSSE